MKVVLAITLVAILGVASGTQFSLCQAPSERRHELVNCVKTHLNEQLKRTFAKNKIKVTETTQEMRGRGGGHPEEVNLRLPRSLSEVKQRLNCEDLDCVFTKICELSSDTHQEHANTFLPDDVKTDVRAALTQCRPSN
ncbi:hypothetical protein MRX96_034177 [Rhipicephalus microplus]